MGKKFEPLSPDVFEPLGNPDFVRAVKSAEVFGLTVSKCAKALNISYQSIYGYYWRSQAIPENYIPLDKQQDFIRAIDYGIETSMFHRVIGRRQNIKILSGLMELFRRQRAAEMNLLDRIEQK